MQINNFLHTKFLCLFVCTLFSMATWSQTRVEQNLTVLTGKVTDHQGLPLENVSVQLLPGRLGTVTSADGFFSIENLSPGEYTLKVSLLNFIPNEQKLVLTVGDTSSIWIKLRSDDKQIADVEVIGKSEVQKKKEEAFTVNAIDTKLYANSNVDLNQILNRSTGVRVRESGGLGSDFNFSVNGLSGKAVRFFIDGIPLETMGTSMSLNNIPVNLAQRVEVYKGVVPVDLGSDALGGAVNVITDQQVRNYLDLSYSYGSFNTHRTAAVGQFMDAKSGLTLRLNAFHNYAKNNYTMENIEVWNEEAYAYLPSRVKRFHDKYQSAMLQMELGVSNKKWADVLFIGGSYSGNRKDIQTGASQEAVFGNAFSKGEAWNSTIRYRKDNLFINGLNFSVFGSYTNDRSEIVDTVLRRYEWDGTWVSSTTAELGNQRSINNIWRPVLFARANLAYEITDNHAINANYTLDRTTNKMFDKYAVSDTTKDVMTKQIIGLSYQQTFFKKRLSNTFFTKYYGTDFAIEQEIGYYSGSAEDGTGANGDWGYGVASRFLLTNKIGIKASMEKAYRLQSALEMLGDGMNTIPNYTLRPENSRNINAGAFLSHEFGFSHHLFLEGGWFYRDVQDFIYPVVLLTNQSQYKNVSAVKVKGWEAEGRYTYGNLGGLMLNVSYQDAVNNTLEYEGKRDISFGNRIPNQPWFFGNMELNIGKDNFLEKDTRVQLNWYTQYVHWFYKTWEIIGDPDGKATIPTQLVHNLMLSYAMQQGKYNVSVECRNLTNETAYDNFRLQKPGRAFYIKFRYFIR
ncbi:TonB-dependent receptor plug domain-containing protein [Sphingobacterium sp. LRF_L2]|uniref:TonB-dependent receptor n=1 Tax=Sphingobacterium sp. LRF_L2 TaxID=3369421 RepID=UPI003F622413